MKKCLNFLIATASAIVFINTNLNAQGIIDLTVDSTMSFGYQNEMQDTIPIYKTYYDDYTSFNEILTSREFSFDRDADEWVLQKQSFYTYNFNNLLEEVEYYDYNVNLGNQVYGTIDGLLTYTYAGTVLQQTVDIRMNQELKYSKVVSEYDESGRIIKQQVLAPISGGNEWKIFQYREFQYNTSEVLTYDSHIQYSYDNEEVTEYGRIKTYNDQGDLLTDDHFDKGKNSIVRNSYYSDGKLKSHTTINDVWPPDPQHAPVMVDSTIYMYSELQDETYTFAYSAINEIYDTLNYSITSRNPEIGETLVISYIKEEETGVWHNYILVQTSPTNIPQGESVTTKYWNRSTLEWFNVSKNIRYYDAAMVDTAIYTFHWTEYDSSWLPLTHHFFAYSYQSEPVGDTTNIHKQDEYNRVNEEWDFIHLSEIRKIYNENGDLVKRIVTGSNPMLWEYDFDEHNRLLAERISIDMLPDSVWNLYYQVFQYYNDSVMGISGAQNEALALWYNSNENTLVRNTTTGALQVLIYNSSAELVQQGTMEAGTNSFHLQNLQTGLYIAEIKQHTKTSTLKFIRVE